MNIIEIYKAVFETAGWVADERGYARIEATNEHVLLKERMIVLPTQEHLQTPDATRKWIFHPLSEYSSRGESEIIKKLKSNINTMLGARFNFLGRELLSLVADPMQQKSLTPDQTSVILGIKEVDDKAIQNWNAMFRNFIKIAPDRGFLNIHLRRGGEYRGESYPRVGLTVFPFYRDMCDESYKNDAIRKKDIETFKQLYRAILPEIDIEEAYNYGYRGTVAPFFCALMNTTAKLAQRFNELSDLFADRFSTDTKTNLDWYKPLQDHDALAPLIRAIPMQEGNDGELIPLQSPNQKQTVQPPPVQNYPYAPPPAGQQPPPYYAGNPSYPAAPYAAPPMAAPEDPYAGGGLSFKKLCRANPNIAQAPNLLGQQLAEKAAYDSWKMNGSMAPAYGHQGYSYGPPPAYQAPYGAPPPAYGPPGYAPPAYGYSQPGHMPPPGYGPPMGGWTGR